MTPLALAAGAAVAGLALFAPLPARSSPLPLPSDPSNPLDYSNEGRNYPNPYAPEDAQMELDMIDPDVNVASFLALLRRGESNDDYFALVGGGRFSGPAHPGWVDQRMIFKSSWAGWHNSHAAGAYQFQPGTFKEASDALGLAGDFGPDSQDAAAVWDLQRNGAYDDVRSGNIAAAWYKLQANEWTSLGVKGLDWTVAQFENNGGTVA